MLPPTIPGLTITPVAPPASAPARQSSSSTDLQKLLKNLGTNIIPIAEQSKAAAAGLTIQPVVQAAPSPTALSAPAGTSNPQAAAEAGMFFKKLPSPMEINNSQLKQPNGAGFFKLPPGTTKYIAENKQRRLAPPSAPPAAAVPAAAAPKIAALPGLAGVAGIDTTLAMAAALQTAILQKVKEPLNGITLNHLIKSGLASQTTANATEQNSLHQKQVLQQQQAQQVQALLQQQAQQLLQQQQMKQQQLAEAKKAEEVKALQEFKRKMEQTMLSEIRKKAVQATPAASQSPAGAVTLSKVPASASPSWTPIDLMILTERMKRAIGGHDYVQFNTMEGQLDWSQVAFGKYSSVDCRSKWAEVNYRETPS